METPNANKISQKHIKNCMHSFEADNYFKFDTRINYDGNTFTE